MSESQPAAEATQPEQAAWSNAQLTKEVNTLKRLNTELHNHVQHALARLSKIERDVRTVASRR